MWDTVIVGKCASCGGVVSRPRVWVGLNRPSTTCENCGSQIDAPANEDTMSEEEARNAMYEMDDDIEDESEGDVDV